MFYYETEVICLKRYQMRAYEFIIYNELLLLILLIMSLINIIIIDKQHN